MTDIQCPQCGHRALSVATRCPRCGHEFSAELLHPLPPLPDRPWLRPALAAVGAVAVVVALSLLLGNDDEAVRAAAGSASDTPTSPTPPTPAPAIAATPAAPVAAAPPPRSVPLAAVPAAAASRRYATNWINVRRDRSLGAPLVRVLRPGDAVMVDSLVRGWYRVVSEGRTEGYAHRRYLAAAPPAP